MPKGVGLWRIKRVGMNGWETFLFSGGKGNFERQSKDIYLRLGLVCSEQPKPIIVIKRLCIRLSLKGRTINIKRGEGK